MVEMVSRLKRRSLSLLLSQTGAVSFEYILVMGGVSAAIMVAFFVDQPTLMITVLGATCSALSENVFNVDCTPWVG